MLGKKLVAVAVSMACSAAFADATLKIDDTKSIAVWGRLVGGVEYLSDVATNGGKTKEDQTLVGQQFGTSIFGVKGQADLGEGTEAQFWLEQGFGSQSGAWNGGRMWQRGSWVALKNKDWGMVRIGNGSFINNYIWGFDPFMLEDYSASTFTSFRNGPRLPNGLRYESPNVNGFEFAAQVNAGATLDKSDGPALNGIVDTGQAWGITAAYKAPEFEVRLIHDVIRSKNGQVDDLLTASKETFVGLKYKITPKTTVRYGLAQYGATDAGPEASNRADHTWFGVTHDVSSRLQVAAAVYNMQISEGKGSAGFNAGRGTMYELGGTYSLSNLSKDTFFYANIARVQNSDTANFSVRPTKDRQPMSGGGQTGIYAGIVHNF